MSLFSAIPGLSIHEPYVAPLVAEQYDAAAAGLLVSATYENVAASFPDPAVMNWLTTNRPDVLAEIKKGRQAIQEAHQAQDLALFRRACDRFQRLHLRAWSVYEQRPPIVETQDALFDGIR
jgi:hypothetical protein